jgi:hypothetical protein
MFGSGGIRAEVYSKAFSEPLSQLLHDLQYERALERP